MTRRTTLPLSALLALILLSSVYAAEDAPRPPTFNEAVIQKAVSFMPADQKPKLTAVEKEIVAGVSPASQGSAQAQPVYFVDTKAGGGPSQLVEQFTLVRKAVADKSSYAKLAPMLGRLAGCVISLCQPYHSEKTAFDSEKRTSFSKELDASAPSLQADFDKLDKIADPSEYAINLAKQASALLKKLESAEASEAAKVRSAVYTLAANSVADCWWAVLSETTSSSSTDGYIGNKRSKKFHRPTCRHLPDEKNRIMFKSRDEAIKEGYEPCKVCKP